ncbi:ABC transporter substrate-binding protein [Pseudoroseomonas ludipueritiae]|uniref:ABC transporter substrate-binding protein n=1 Tax=Pseudoroseomonas ludipueritiae TaxID=198093 RepID=A0ABR7REV9_9PROT|nr:ABC transporter substrate-binding protein [Pseudoroseomonas ludipueritiae]MBC9180367.1 ABC transporter substrate-binding protein [Pseudoroseomonas ludipueritiae]
MAVANFRLKAALLMGSAMLSLAMAQPAAAQNVTIAIGGSVTSLDPHFYNASPNHSAAAHFFERLTEFDSNAKMQPALAESWKAVAPDVWEFKLRPGVKWHDGRDFTAEDVAFTIERAPNVPNSPGGFGAFVRGVKSVEIVDPLTIRFHTPGPYPLLPVDFASLFVISRHVGQNASTEDYNSGKAVVGTGPYRFNSYTPGNRVQMTRNDNYWGGKPDWATVDFRIISNPAARTAAILSGDVDIIDTVPSSDIPKLRQDPKVQVTSIQGLRLIYLAPDRSRDENPVFVTDNDGKPLARNPFNDLRVRRALSMAVSREALAERVMEDTAKPAGQWLPPGTYSYNPEVKPLEQDLEGARKLLAEAGFPRGFRMTLHTPNDRYPNDAKTAQAVAQMWTRAGVQTTVEALPWSTYSVRSNRQEFGIRLMGWGSLTGEASYALVNIIGTYSQETRFGANNSGRYSNPELDALTLKATSTLDDEEREKLLQQAIKMAIDDVAIIPLHQLVNTWAVKKGLQHSPRMDERTRAIDLKPAKG